MKKRDIIYVIITIVLVIAGVAGYEIFGNSSANAFKVTYFSIGKADAILLENNQNNILIDTGEDDDGQDIIDYIQNAGITELDLLILTHFDKDHIGGAAAIISQVAIKRILVPDYISDSQYYKNMQAAINLSNVLVQPITEKTFYEFKTLKLTVFPPNLTEYENENDFSLMVSANFYKKSFLFTGDALETRIDEFLQYGAEEYSVLKIPHHGRYSGGTQRLIDSINPEIAVITCSEKNPPDKEVMDILSSRNIKTYLTDEENIVLFTDGIRVWKK